MAESSSYLQWIEIDLDRLTDNIGALCNHLTKGTEFAAVVKKNAYGCGAPAIARAALRAGAKSLAVHALEEALSLRESGITAPILVMGALSVTEVSQAVEQNLTCTVTDGETALTLSEASEKLK